MRAVGALADLPPGRVQVEVLLAVTGTTARLLAEVPPVATGAKAHPRAEVLPVETETTVPP